MDPIRLCFVVTQCAVFSLRAHKGGFVATKVITLPGYEGTLMGEAKFPNGANFLAHDVHLRIGEPMTVGLNPVVNGFVSTPVQDITDVMPGPLPKARIRVVD